MNSLQNKLVNCLQLSFRHDFDVQNSDLCSQRKDDVAWENITRFLRSTLCNYLSDEIDSYLLQKQKQTQRR